jgi:hypothetical protein
MPGANSAPSPPQRQPSLELTFAWSSSTSPEGDGCGQEWVANAPKIERREGDEAQIGRGYGARRLGNKKKKKIVGTARRSRVNAKSAHERKRAARGRKNSKGRR